MADRRISKSERECLRMLARECAPRLRERSSARPEAMPDRS